MPQNVGAAMILQCQNYKSERIIYRGSARLGTALRARNTNRHYEFRVFRPPPIFRMRSIYEYVTKSRGKPSWTREMVFRSCGKRGFARVGARAVLPTACQPFHAILLRVLDVHVVVLSLAQLRCPGKYCGSSVNPRERSSPTAFLCEKALRRADDFYGWSIVTPSVMLQYKNTGL